MTEHPFFAGLKAPLHISHRGGAALAPENTLSAFQSAVTQWKTDMLELDIRATADGHVVVFHDETVDRVTDGAGPIAQLSLAKLQTLNAGFHFSLDGRRPFQHQAVKVPLLSEVLTAFPDIRVNCELKSADVLEPFARLAEKHGWLNRLCIGAELDGLVHRIHERLPDALLFYPRDALASLIMSIHGGEKPEVDPRYRVLDMPVYWEGMRIFTPEVAKACRDAGIWVNVWTVDDEADMRQCLTDGVQGVMTDRPDILRRVLDSLSR